MRTSTQGVELIKEFEGVELTAYPDPGSGAEPWTIGYGHTSGVKPGDTITEEEAEDLLIQDLGRFENAVSGLIDVELNQNEFDALVSFAFNVGEGALGDSTLRRRLNAGEDKCPVFHTHKLHFCYFIFFSFFIITIVKFITKLNWSFHIVYDYII